MPSSPSTRIGSALGGTPNASARAGRRPPTGHRLIAAAPWIAVMAITAAVQVVRLQWFDAILFATAGSTIAVLAVRPPRPWSGRVPSWICWVTAAAAICVISFVPRHTLAVGLLVTAVGILAVLSAPGGGRAREARHLAPKSPFETSHRGRRTAAVIWTLLAVSLCLVELTSFILGHTGVAAPGDFPAISELVDPLLDQPWGRLLLVAAWVLAGRALVMRGART